MSALAELVGVAQPTDDTCLPACVATILRVPLDQTPKVRFDLGAAAWWPVFVDEVVERFGIEIMNVHHDPPPRGFWIALVPSQGFPGKPHAVVMRGASVVWDPSESGRYEQTSLADVLHCFLLVPLRPAPSPLPSEAVER